MPTTVGSFSSHCSKAAMFASIRPTMSGKLKHNIRKSGSDSI